MSIDKHDEARALEIYYEIKDLMDELNTIFRRNGGMTYERWKSYPYAHIRIAMDNDHDYLGKNTFTVQELVKDLGEDDDEDDVDNDDAEEDSDDSGLPGDSRGFPQD